jgi:hypothetical protein
MSKVQELSVRRDEYVKLCPTFERICGDFLDGIGARVRVCGHTYACARA